MIQVKIQNVASGEYTHGSQFDSSELAQAWIDSQLSKGLKCPWGKPEHTIQVEVSPCVPAEYDEEGNLLTPEVLATYEDQVMPSEFEVETIDVTSQKEQEAINAAALKYLAETDWIVTRAMEREEELSSEFKAEREAARASIIR